MRHSHNAGRIAGAEFRHLPHAVRMVSRVQHIARCTLLRTVAQQRPCLPVMSSRLLQHSAQRGENILARKVKPT